MFHYYRQLIGLRKKMDVVSEGDIRPLSLEDERIFAYEVLVLYRKGEKA